MRHFQAYGLSLRGKNGGASMSKQIPDEDYAAQIKAIFADQDMVAAMRRRFPKQRERVDPALRDRRWDEAVAIFGGEEADCWTPRKRDGKLLP